MSQITATARALSRAFSRATRAAQAGKAIYARAWFRELYTVFSVIIAVKSDFAEKICSTFPKKCASNLDLQKVAFLESLLQIYNSKRQKTQKASCIHNHSRGYYQSSVSRSFPTQEHVRNRGFPRIN